MHLSFHILDTKINNNKNILDNLKIDNKYNKDFLNLLIIENKNLKFRIIELEKNINLINIFLNLKLDNTIN